MRPLEQSLPLKLLKAREAVMSRFRPHLNAHDITEQQWRILRALTEFGEIDMGTLSERIAILPPSLSRILPDLEKRGLINRRKHEADARITYVAIAPKGHTLFETMSAHSEVIYRDLQRLIGREDLKTLMSALDHLITAIGATPARDVETRRTVNRA
jgi:homoprotocatechuate degradation regulator HpaR